MPNDDNINNNGRPSDIIGNGSNDDSWNSLEIAYLQEITNLLKKMLSSGAFTSQTRFQTEMPTREEFRKSYEAFRQASKETRTNAKRRSGTTGNQDRSVVGTVRSNIRIDFSKIVDEFLDEFESSLFDSLIGSDFKKVVQSGLSRFASDLGTTIEDLPKEAGRQMADIVRNSGAGNFVHSVLSNQLNKFSSYISRLYEEGYGPRTSAGTSQTATAGFGTDFAKRIHESNASLYNSIDELYEAIFNKSADNIHLEKSRVVEQDADVLSTLQSIEYLVESIYNRITSEDSNNTVQEIAKQFPDIIKPSQSSIVDVVSSGLQTATGGSGGGGLISTGTDMLLSTADDFLPMLTNTASTAGKLSGAMGGLTSIVTRLGGPMLAIAIASELLEPLLSGITSILGALSKAFGRYQDEREKNLELEKERLEADVKAMIEAPFTILEDAAQEVYDAWDSTVRVINGTQGYSKSDLQDLMAAYADRIREDNLTRVVSGADITENLTKVLESGLSGAIAEEFAYRATILNAAIPTQDFFSYADTYASLAANAIQQGMSESAAIDYANEQLELFASNILYASRQLTGGFTTGLQNAETLFEQAVQIAQASREGNPSEIAGVLTAVSAATGAVAPDLASSITNAIYSAATGGNSSTLVALRSLAGINASNTEFLRALAEDPQKVFVDLFTNLANMQSMSDGAYMEVAEGLSSLFGLDMDAFSRIDFNYLADAIANMEVSNNALQENIAHLASGETTTNAEQLRMQQINEYMIEEGLSYVLDNEVARTIQQHMWDEQLAREMQSATYAVDLQGSALDLLEGLMQTVQNILNIFNPFAWFSGIANIFQTGSEVDALRDDLDALLEAGKVGAGNPLEKYQLTTTGNDLYLTDDIVTLFGGTGRYGAENGFDWFNDMAHWILSGEADQNQRDIYQYQSYVNDLVNNMPAWDSDFRSGYAWASVGKSTASLLYNDGNPVGTLLSSPYGTSASTGSSSGEDTSVNVNTEAIRSRLEQMMDPEYVQENFVSQRLGYEDWAASARDFGIADLDTALESVGLDQSDLESYYTTQQTAYANQYAQERDSKEEIFWQTTIDNTTAMVEMMDSNTTWLRDIHTLIGEFYGSWVDYFVNHTAYNAAYDYSDVERIQSEEESGKDTAIYALAEALSQNTVDLKDPAVQTNALLSQILIVLQAIMQQNNGLSTGASLADTLQGLALGLVKQ